MNLSQHAKRHHHGGATFLHLSLSLIWGLLAACQSSGGDSSNEALFKVNGSVISRKDLSKANQMELYQEDEESFSRKRRALEGIAGEHLFELEAKKLGISREDLMKREIEEKTPLVTEAEVDEMYNSRKAEIQKQIDATHKDGPKPTAKEIKGVLSRQMQGQKRRDRMRNYATELQTTYKLEYVAKAPEAPRVDIGTADNPEKGPKTAKVTIIEFSDFQCPYCARALPVLADLQKEYGDKIRIVFRDFPLSFHDTAKIQAQAGGCAHEQGKFWELHDLLFDQTSQSTIASGFHQKKEDGVKESLAKLAEKTSLNLAQFKECVESDKFSQEVDKDIHAGLEAGVRSTPSFFINGRMVAGAQPVSEFKKIIDEELKR